MASLLSWLLVAASVVMLIPVTVLFVEVIGAMPRMRVRVTQPAERPSLAVIVPAHDEALMITATLRALNGVLGRSDRVVVVADNCSDDTAALAAAEGAQVVVRQEPARRGKGYALDRGLRALAAAPPEVVLILDADCRIDRHSLDTLAATCRRSGRPVQATYVIDAPSGAGVFTRIAAFALIVKNQVRALGAHRLGLPCHLMGTGMVFPWPVLSTAPLATQHIVEDVKLGVALALAGKPPLFCPEAIVSSVFPQSPEGLRAQRVRWEHGHLDVALRDAPRLLVRGLLGLRLELISLGLDLCVPPLALLLLLVVSVWLASACLFLFSGAATALILSAAALMLLGLSVTLAWSRYGRQIVSLRELLLAGPYALRKAPLYVRFLRARQSEWVRSKRD